MCKVNRIGVQPYRWVRTLCAPLPIAAVELPIRLEWVYARAGGSQVVAHEVFVSCSADLGPADGRLNNKQQGTGLTSDVEGEFCRVGAFRSAGDGIDQCIRSVGKVAGIERGREPQGTGGRDCLS